jgi:hypothetical protein
VSEVEAKPGPRIMRPADAPPFRHLRDEVQTNWLPAMQALLDIPTASLPALWDADFLYAQGPRMDRIPTCSVRSM